MEAAGLPAPEYEETECGKSSDKYSFLAQETVAQERDKVSESPRPQRQVRSALRRWKQKMKNQYIGDIGDYGKYGLLRFLAQRGLRIGVNWYLTENDDSSDGKFVDYLNKEELRSADPTLFDFLRSIAF